MCGLWASGGVVSADAGVAAELTATGWGNDLLRLVQQGRKDAGLDVSDRITLALQVPDELWPAVEARQEQVEALRRFSLDLKSALYFKCP